MEAGQQKSDQSLSSGVSEGVKACEASGSQVTWFWAVAQGEYNDWVARSWCRDQEG